MSKEQLPYITALAAIVSPFVAVIVVYLTHTFTRRRLDREYLLKRAEELYIAVKEYHYIQKFRLAPAFFKKDKEEAQPNSLEVDKEVLKRLAARDRMEMIIDIYFPQLGNDIAYLMREEVSIGRFEMTKMPSIDTEQGGTEVKMEAARLAEKLDKLAREFIMKLSEETERIRKGWF